MSTVPQIIRRRRNRRQRSRSGPALYGGISAFALLAVLVVLALGGVVAAGLLTYFRVAGVVPANPQVQRDIGLSDQATALLDRTGQQVLVSFTGASEDVPWVELDQLPPVVIDTTIAIQDGNFFNRDGFSFAKMFSSLADSLVYGTLTINDPIAYYLAQHVILPPHEMPLDHPDRLLNDTIIMLELQRRFTREELLAWFLNTAMYGNGAYGIEAAAQTYLGKPARDLTLGEAALLAGIPDKPSTNPFSQPEAAYDRQKLVLDTMTAYGMIDAEAARSAQVRVTLAQPLAPDNVVAPHYALVARRQAELLLDEAGYDGARLVASGGIRIITTLDLDLQYQAECALRTYVARLGGVDPSFVFSTAIGDRCRAAELLPELPAEDVGFNHDVSNGAVVVMRPETGEVLAYVGSVDYWNAAINGMRDAAGTGYQPGSLIRPYIYLTALSQGYTPAKMTLDIQQRFEQAFGGYYEPVNSNGVYLGPISLREAIVYDSTPAAVEVMNWVSAADVIQTAHRMGISTLLDGPSTYDLSLAVQGGDVTLADLTYSFGVLANNGHMVGAPVSSAQLQPGFRALTPVSILRIESTAGEMLWSYQPESRDTLAPQLAYLLNDMMGDRELRVQAYGAQNVYEIGRPAAVQGGGSGDARDWWTVGYTPHLSVGVWLGNNDRVPTTRLTAQNGPAPVWHAVMAYAHQRDDLPLVDWQPPPGVVEVPVCAVSGLLPTEYCPVVSELFADGTQPIQQDFYYQMVEINRQNGKRATASTPRDLVEQRVYFVYPEEAQEWAAAEGILGPPTEYDSVGPPVAFGPVAILSPEPLSYVSGTLTITGNATLPGFQYYQLAYGQGLNPPNWTQLGDRNTTPARGDFLGRWDTTGLEGLYSLRLTVVAEDQTVEESVIQVTVDNTPPEVSISAPEPEAQVAVAGNNPVLDVAVAYLDNVGVSQVIYYLDGEAVTTVIEPPFTAAVVIDSLGNHSIWAEAFDEAGNSSLSERVTFLVRRGDPTVP